MSRELIAPADSPFFSPDPSHADLATDAELAAAVTAHEGLADPHPGYATDTDLTNHAADFDAHTLPWVRSYKSVIAGSTISTTEAVEQTFNLTIPGDWASYDIEAECDFGVLESGTLTAARNVNFRWRLGTTVAGTQFGLRTTAIQNVASNRYNVPLSGYRLGETATGVISVVFTSDISGDTGQVSYDEFTGRVTALRVT